MQWRFHACPKIIICDQKSLAYVIRNSVGIYFKLSETSGEISSVIISNVCCSMMSTMHAVYNPAGKVLWVFVPEKLLAGLKKTLSYQ